MCIMEDDLVAHRAHEASSGALFTNHLASYMCFFVPLDKKAFLNYHVAPSGGKRVQDLIVYIGMRLMVQYFCFRLIDFQNQWRQ